jgi:hypothetical protein
LNEEFATTGIYPANLKVPGIFHENPLIIDGSTPNTGTTPLNGRIGAGRREKFSY